MRVPNSDREYGRRRDCQATPAAPQLFSPKMNSAFDSNVILLKFQAVQLFDFDVLGPCESFPESTFHLLLYLILSFFLIPSSLTSSRNLGWHGIR